MKKTFSILLVLMLLLPSAGCLGKPVKHFEVPADFSFSLTWGCYGISSYDSRTGKLVKTTDATHLRIISHTIPLPVRSFLTFIR